MCGEPAGTEHKDKPHEKEADELAIFQVGLGPGS
jgi:hypothetical protein